MISLLTKVSLFLSRFTIFEQARYEALVADQEAAEATDVGESPEGQRLRSLENRYDKAQLKCTEAEHIKQTYEQVSCLSL